MIKMINRVTGTIMWIAEERKDEYLAAGHKLAAESSAAPTEKPKKRTTKKEVKK